MGLWYFVSAAQSCVIGTTLRTRFRRRSSCWLARLVRSDIPHLWPVGGAARFACHARSAKCRRRRHEQSASLADPWTIEPRLDDLAEVVHSEIDSLPAQYRAAVLLCDIEGLTEGQAARRLGRPLGTIR